MQLSDLPVDTVLLILYHYIPSKAAATAAVVLYAIVSVAVTAVTMKTRAYYMLTVAITGFLELAGESCLGLLRLRTQQRSSQVTAGQLI